MFKYFFSSSVPAAQHAHKYGFCRPWSTSMRRAPVTLPSCYQRALEDSGSTWPQLTQSSSLTRIGTHRMISRPCPVLTALARTPPSTSTGVHSCFCSASEDSYRAPSTTCFIWRCKLRGSCTKAADIRSGRNRSLTSSSLKEDILECQKQ